MPKMRAKMRVQSVTRYDQTEALVMYPVTTSRYSDDGFDEDNTFAKFSPSGKLELSIANPALIGQFNPGDTLYVDFTPAG